MALRPALLNRPPLKIEPEIQEPETDFDVDTTPPKESENISAIRSMKNKKADVQDKLSAELFKVHPELQPNYFSYSLQQYGKARK